MIYETYTTSLRSGQIEFGFTFKESGDCDDSLFDLAIGALPVERSLEMEAHWDRLEWAAKAICEAAPDA